VPEALPGDDNREEVEMHDYDLDKITRKVTGLCRAKGLWPDCVKLPEAEYRAIFGENGLRGKQTVILIDDVKDLYFESGPVVCPVVHYSMSLSNADTVKDKPQPPGYRDPVISDRCGDCCRFSLAKSLGWCKKFDCTVDFDGICDDFEDAK
jgi:hypothetical protein